MSTMSVGWNMFKQSDFGAGNKLSQHYGHAFRKENMAKNALEDMRDENIILIGDGMQSWEDAIKRRYNELKDEGTQVKKVRSDANVGIEFVFNYSNDLDERLNREEWSLKIKKFLFDEFGKENVTHMIMHLDEPVKDGNEILYSGAHIHAFAIPVDRQRGVISNTPHLRFWNQQMQFHQRFYEEVAKEYGCDRPKVLSPRENNPIQKWYTSTGDTKVQAEISMSHIRHILEKDDKESDIEWAKRIKDNIENVVRDEFQMIHMTALKEKEIAQVKAMESANKAYIKSQEAQKELKHDKKLLKRYDLADESFEQVCNYARFMKYTLNGLKHEPKEIAEPLQKSLTEISNKEKERRELAQSRENNISK